MAESSETNDTSDPTQVVRLLQEGDEFTAVPLDELPRAEQTNPLGLTEAELCENEEWKRLLRQRHPGMPDLFIESAITYYRIKGPEELQREIDAGNRASDTRRDELQVNCNTHAEPGTQLRMSMVEFSIPNDGVLSEAEFDGQKVGVTTVYVRIEGASLMNRESQQLGAAPGAPPNPQLFSSTIIAKVGINRTNPPLVETLYPPTERTASVILPHAHLGSFTVRVTDSQGNPLGSVVGLEEFFGPEGTSFFSCSLRVDTVRVSENDGGSLVEPPSGINPKYDHIDFLVGNQASRENARQYLA